jgi:hypothetical protein
MVSSLGDYLSVETQHQKVERNGETWLPNPEVYFQGILILSHWDLEYLIGVELLLVHLDQLWTLRYTNLDAVTKKLSAVLEGFRYRG